MGGMQVLLCVCIMLVGVYSSSDGQQSTKRIPKQINKGMMLGDEDEDRKAEGTGFENFGGFENGGGDGGGGKYFMYQHVPKKDHYEFGFKRGNEHHIKERHEKAHPHIGHFKTKVRWADKHGGHGEHYWDYNHHGHHGDGADGDEDDEASDRVNSYSEDRSKREETKEPVGDITPEKLPSLVYNVDAKTVTDRNTGQVYALHPIG